MSSSSGWSSPEPEPERPTKRKPYKKPPNVNHPKQKLPYHKRLPTRISTCSIPKEVYDQALAELMQPRAKPRPVRRQSRKDEKLCDSDDEEGCGKPQTGPSDTRAAIMRRCQRVTLRAVHEPFNDTRSDNYQPTDLTAMLCNISQCIRNEDWKYAVRLLELATKRKQSHHSRLALYRMAYVVFLYDPVLKDSGLLEGFMQGVFGCRNDAEIQDFIRKSATCPDDAGFIRCDEQSQKDEKRLSTLSGKSEDGAEMDDRPRAKSEDEAEADEIDNRHMATSSDSEEDVNEKKPIVLKSDPEVEELISELLKSKSLAFGMNRRPTRKEPDDKQIAAEPKAKTLKRVRNNE